MKVKTLMNMLEDMGEDKEVVVRIEEMDEKFTLLPFKVFKEWKNETEEMIVIEVKEGSD